MPDVLASAEARRRLPKMIEELVAHREEQYEVGRQRRREVVVVAASRFDEMMEREAAVQDLAWAAFAQERVENPASGPVSRQAAQSRRRHRRR
ncbi:MAG: hypothetical protein ACR2J6_06020 [Thermoleophilaceae bacterium]